MFARKRKATEALLQSLHAEVAALQGRVEKEASEVAAVRADLQALTNRLSNVDDRVTQMATALTNQLHELDSEITNLAANSDAASAEAVKELRSNQVRIASEQARYAIALRADLAELAELLRRVRG